MKKFLLPLAAVAFTAAMASAETVTFDFVNETYGLERLSGSTSEYIAEGTTIENDGVTLTFTSALGEESKNGAGSRLWGDGLRCYNGAEVTVSVASGTIDEITFEAKTPASFTLEGNTIRYTPTSKQVPITSITVEYTPEGGVTLQPAGLEFGLTEFAIELGEEFVAPALVNPNNLPVTWTSSNEEVATVNAEGAVTIIGAGTTTITAESEATDTFRAGKASYTLKVTSVLKASSIADLLVVAPANSKAEVKIDFPMTVTFKSGAYTYVTDGTNYTLLYALPTDYEALDIIPAGWTAVESAYNGLTEFKAVGDMPAADGKGEFTPREVSAEEVSLEMVNAIVIIKDVEFTEATPENRSSVVANGVTFYNQFGIESQEADLYNVKAAVTVFKENLQVYPIEYMVSTGIASIEAEGAAAYFDLQGRAVKGNLAKGLYIKVQNGKATKVLVK